MFAESTTHSNNGLDGERYLDDLRNRLDNSPSSSSQGNGALNSSLVTPSSSSSQIYDYNAPLMTIRAPPPRSQTHRAYDPYSDNVNPSYSYNNMPSTQRSYADISSLIGPEEARRIQMEELQDSKSRDMARRIMNDDRQFEMARRERERAAKDRERNAKQPWISYVPPSLFANVDADKGVSGGGGSMLNPINVASNVASYVGNKLYSSALGGSASNSHSLSGVSRSSSKIYPQLSESNGVKTKRSSASATSHPPSAPSSSKPKPKAISSASYNPDAYMADLRRRIGVSEEVEVDGTLIHKGKGKENVRGDYNDEERDMRLAMELQEREILESSNVKAGGTLSFARLMIVNS